VELTARSSASRTPSSPAAPPSDAPALQRNPLAAEVRRRTPQGSARAAKFGLTLYPLKDDGEVLPPVPPAAAMSPAERELRFEHCHAEAVRYMEFGDISGVAGLAILTKLIRSQPNGSESSLAGRFRRICKGH